MFQQYYEREEILLPVINEAPLLFNFCFIIQTEILEVVLLVRQSVGALFCFSYCRVFCA